MCFIIVINRRVIELISDYQLSFEEEDDSLGLSVITLEVLADTNPAGPDGHSQEALSTVAEPSPPISIIPVKSIPEKKPNDKDTVVELCTENRYAWLEYVPRTDGSVVCKRCGEILKSRTQWYRHKYKRHVVQPFSPSPLYQCEQCLVFFKSRKGYIGHLASRHSESTSDPNDTTTSEGEVNLDNLVILEPFEIKSELETEVAATLTVPYLQPTPHSSAKTESKKSNKGNKDIRNKEDWEKRYQEEKLVADIIDRVKRECEAQGSGGGERRGYTRRTTVMHTAGV